MSWAQYPDLRALREEAREKARDRALRELHVCMYPELYYTPTQMAELGYDIDLDAGEYWRDDAATLAAMADVFKLHARHLTGLISARRTPFPGEW
jgi:hypothetical protein